MFYISNSHDRTNCGPQGLPDRKETALILERKLHSSIDMVGNVLVPYRVRPQADGHHLRNMSILGTRNAMVDEIVIGY